MNIIILGAGQVGGTLAENLVAENNDVTLIDTNADILQELQNRLDIRTLVGRGSHPNILEQADAEDADMLIAVTNDDETNITACQVAYTLFQTPTKIARIRAQQYLTRRELFHNDAIPIDVCISPEQLVTTNIERLIEYQGSLQVVDFADGKMQLVSIKPYYGGALVGKSIEALHDHLPEVETRVAAIYRGDESIPLSKDTVIEIGDEVFFIAASNHIRAVMGSLRRLESPFKRVMIAGGGNIGHCLASALEDRYLVKVIDRNKKRTQFLAQTLSHATILLGSGTDKELLVDENVENVDVFCALTNDDEANILSCLQAKRLGARQVIALITRPAYVDLIEDSDIDIVVSPQQVTIGSILTYVRRGDIVKVHSLRRGAAEAIEAVAHGDRETSRVVGRRLREIKLPPGTTIAAVVRGHQTIIAKDDTLIESGDHVILFVVEKKRIADVEQLFQVKLTYV